MPEIQDGETIEVQGSARQPYVLKNIGGVYSCSCPAWRNQSLPIEARTCKHLRQLRGEAAEQQRVGRSPLPPAQKTKRCAPPLLLANRWSEDCDPAGWWLSEKLDGVRAYWDGRQFLSRLGNPYHAPSWFTAGLPPIPLDGELWLDRKAFQRTISIVRRHDDTPQWREINYVVFDAPGVRGDFESRQGFLQTLFGERPLSHARALPQERCKDRNHLRDELARVESLGGEGLMLRQQGSLYEAGRSNTLLKVKSFQDAEGRVVDHVPGRGRHKGRLGSLVVALPDSTTFAVGAGLSDAQRENPPAIGSVVTFRFQELTEAGVPRFPTFVRVHEAEISGV